MMAGQIWSQKSGAPTTHKNGRNQSFFAHLAHHRTTQLQPVWLCVTPSANLIRQPLATTIHHICQESWCTPVSEGASMWDAPSPIAYDIVHLFGIIYHTLKSYRSCELLWIPHNFWTSWMLKAFILHGFSSHSSWFTATKWTGSFTNVSQSPCWISSGSLWKKCQNYIYIYICICICIYICICI